MPLKYFQWGNFRMGSSYFPHPPLLFDKLCDIILYLFEVAGTFSDVFLRGTTA